MSISNEETFNRVVGIVAEKLNVARDSIKPGSSFKDLGADSLDVVELVMTLEESFNIEISDDDAESMVTIQDTVDYILKLSS